LKINFERYLCISFFATYHLLTENNIFPSDMHTANIFIHWLDDNSYYNTINIKNLKEIVYKIGKKYYKIKTFGFVLILCILLILKINYFLV
jgi:hypothetical protein